MARVISAFARRGEGEEAEKSGDAMSQCETFLHSYSLRALLRQPRHLDEKALRMGPRELECSEDRGARGGRGNGENVPGILVGIFHGFQGEVDN